VEFVFTIPGVHVFLSGKLSQDALEKFFGQQRQRGRANKNPNVMEFIRNTQALRVVNGICRNIRGNCRGSNNEAISIYTSEPLPKRKRS
jgi:hypothetical protein